MIKNGDVMIKDINVIKDYNKDVECTNCKEQILKTDKRLVRDGSHYGLQTTNHYCIKCAKMLLRRIMIELH